MISSLRGSNNAANQSNNLACSLFQSSGAALGAWPPAKKETWEVAAALGVCFGWEPGATLGGLRAAVGAAGGTPRAEFLQLIYERNARSI